MSALAIIDMQPFTFNAAKHDQVIRACQREIKLAMRNNEFIFYVYYEGCGHTSKKLTSLTKNYKNKMSVKKTDSDGAMELMRVANNNGISLNNVRICGVNASCCVRDTVETLMEYYKCVVIADALGEEIFPDSYLHYSSDTENEDERKTENSRRHTILRELREVQRLTLGFNVFVLYKHNMRRISRSKWERKAA